MELSPFNFWRRIEELHRRIQSLIAETLAPLAPASPLDVEADFFPPADIYTTDEYSTVVFSVPGVLPEDLDLSIEGDSLTVRGKVEPPTRGKTVLKELPSGNFIRRVTLPYPPDETKTPEAELSDGLLIVRIRHTKGE